VEGWGGSGDGWLGWLGWRLAGCGLAVWAGLGSWLAGVTGGCPGGVCWRWAGMGLSSGAAPPGGPRKGAGGVLVGGLAGIVLATMGVGLAGSGG